jgi:hypothetical protein
VTSGFWLEGPAIEHLRVHPGLTNCR